MWVIFEGLDKSGKGTLEREFLKATNYKHIVIDRGPVGYALFDVLLGRVEKSSAQRWGDLINDMKKCNDFIVVYCKVPAVVAMQRVAEHNEECPKYEYDFAQYFYDLGIKKLYEEEGIKVITVDTTKTIEECVELILGGLK